MEIIPPALLVNSFPPLPLPVGGSLPSPASCCLVPPPRCTGSGRGILGPAPPQTYGVRSPPSFRGILGPPPPADLREDGAASPSPPPPDIQLAVSWRPPPDGWIKLNTDGSFVGRDSFGGAGFVARDCEGRFVFAGASGCRAVNPLYSELWAIRAALMEAVEAGVPRVLLESDSTSAVRLLGGGIKNAPPGTEELVEDCLALRCCFREIIVQHTYREGNRVADRLAALGRRSSRDRLYQRFEDLPDAVTRDLILFDRCGGATVRPRKH